MRKARRSTSPDRVVLRAGPFGGVIDATDPGEHAPDVLFDAVNMLVPNPGRGSAVVARHGFGAIGAQLGTAGQRTGQTVYQHRRLDGTLDRFVVCGGVLYRWDGLSTFTTITPSGVTIDPASPVFCATFADQLIVTDGVNPPWRYDPATTTAVLLDYDGLGTSWAAVGPPVVYAGKLFFIIDAVGQSELMTEAGDGLTTESGESIHSELLSGLQNTITWSEEATPQTGYQQPNFDNAWELTQTSSEALTCLVAEEGALFYFRRFSIGVITGAMNSDFRNATSRDTISSTVGTSSAASVRSFNRVVTFADVDGRPWRLVVGGGQPEPLHLPVRRVVESQLGTSGNRATIEAGARSAVHEGLNLVLFRLWDSDALYVFDAASGAYLGTWSLGAGVHIDALGPLSDSATRAVCTVLATSGATDTADAHGYLWRQKFADDANQWLDQPDLSVATYLPITRATETGVLARDPVETVHLDVVTLQVLGDASPHAVTVQHWTPNGGRSAGQEATSTATLGDVTSTDTVSRVVVGVGPDASGTMFRLRVTWTHADNVQAGLHAVAAQGVVQPADPWNS